MAELDSALDAVITAVGGERREGQRVMAHAVGDALNERDHLLIQAGTGTGKSLGYLVPAAIHAVNSDQAVVIATATLALQRQLIERELPIVSAALAPLLGRPITYAVLKGRSNYVCRQRLHGGVTDEPTDQLAMTPGSRLEEQAAALRTWALSSESGDRDDYPDSVDARVWSSISVTRRECVGESKCSFGEECFTALRRAEAHEADIVITNHALLAIDAIEGVPVLPEHSAIIVDEAHELVDRVTNALSVTLSPALIDRAIARMRALVDAPALERIQVARDGFEEAVRESGPGRITQCSERLQRALRLLRQSATLPALPDAEPVVRQRAQGLIDEITQATDAVLNAGVDDVVWVDDGGRLHLAPLDIAGPLKERLFDAGPVILTSATLTVGTGFDAVTQALGLGSDVTCLDVGSPFDYQQQGILYVAADVPPPGRDGVAMESLDLLAELIEAAGGRTLALFSSWAGVERAAEYLQVRLDDSFPLLVQARGDSTGPLLTEFAAKARSTLIGTLALWQGVDVPGEACVCVAIDRIPFPRPDDPLMAARQQRVDEQGGSGFRRVALPRAALLLAQGSGRLIRHTSDRGVVAVLDSRMATAGYGRTLRAGLPPFWYTTDKAPVLGALRRLDAEFSATADEAR